MKKYTRVTTNTLKEMKLNREKISMLTAYDFTTAKIIDKSEIDVILVGDSASNVIAGHETTLPITLDEIIYHAKCVIRAVKRALVVVDLPFGSYQGNSTKALESAIKIMKESEAHAVKMEGGEEISESVSRIIKSGIPVMGHLGLTPQSIYNFGTYSVRAKETKEANKLINDAKILEKNGCFSIVLEKVPSSLGKKVTKTLKVPTIGIGAGKHVDGQVLVTHDMLGMTQDFNPRFIRRYADLNKEISKACKNYIKDVKANKFPNENESY